ncbi:MAG: hypothetical protein LBV31_02425, partial [Prevotellaceae bacterium]|nr:hypothetical protein [Prevotellaceae bacterium]
MTKENINKSYKKVSRLFILAYFSILLTVLVGYYFGNKNGLWEALSAEATALTSFYYIFLLTIIPLSFYVFFKKTAKWAALSNETEKLKKYENGAIWRLVGIWASGFIGTIIY